MVSSLLWLFGAAWADCPSPDAAIARAEEDALAYFVADADAALHEASSAFGCASTSTETLTRYWLAKAMVWELMGDDRSSRALAAAKALEPEQFTEELGADLEAKWKAIDPASVAPAVDVRIRGLARNDVVLVDTRPVDPPRLPLGLHLVQVVRGEEVLLGRILEATADNDVSLSLKESPPSGPSAPLNLQLSFQGPLSLDRHVLAADGKKLDFQLDVLPVAMLTNGGREAYTSRRRNTRLQAVAVGLGVLGGYTAYVAGHKTLTDADDNVEWGLATLTTGAVSLTGITWELVLRNKRRALKRQAVDSANTVLGSLP